MKNKKLIMILAITLIAILIFVGGFYFVNTKDGHKMNVVKKDITVESENIDSYKHIKKMEEGRLFYLGLDSIFIDGQDLLEYLNDHDIDELKQFFNKVDNYKDGGSALYTCDDEKKCDNDIKVLFCNTLAGDKDVYISEKNHDLTADYCNNDTNEPENPEEMGE